MSGYRQTTLRVDGHLFDMWALKRAYTRLGPTFETAGPDYSEQALTELVELFCDWSPARMYNSPANVYSKLNTDAVASLSSLSEEQKRDLYQNCCSEIARVLREDHGIEATNAEVKRFAGLLADDGTRREIAEFMLDFLGEYAKHLARFDPRSDETTHLDTPLQDFLNAIRDLPDEYLDAKRTQYEGETKINRIRFEVVDAIRSGNELSVTQFEELCREEDSRHETAIRTGYSSYSILGQLYYDYAKLRLDGYLTRLTAYFADELDIETHARHTCSFVEPRNQLNQYTWAAIHPGKDDTSDEYQLYFGIKPSNVQYGLHVGDNLRDSDNWDQDRDLEKRSSSSSGSIDDVIDKLDTVRNDYMVLNGLRDTGGSDESVDDDFEPPDDAETFARQLEQNGQLVFYGPPGTGKTYSAEQFAKWWTSDGPSADSTVEQFRAVTFHPSFAYEDFLEGLSADATDEGMVEYEMDAGVFKSIAEDAKEAYENATGDAPRFVLVIDEINRGNLAQIFGETITQLETDKRLDATNELTVHLAHSDEPFVVPPNLYIVGTMNTADRSVALVDAALRRRFRFMYFPPDYDVLAKRHDFADRAEVRSVAESGPQRDRVLLALSIEALEAINARILNRADLGKGKQIGHSYLWNCATSDDVDQNVRSLVETWKYEILPLLEEYFFGQFERLQREVFGDDASEVLDVDHRQIAAFGEPELRRALAALTDHAGEVTATAMTTTQTDV